MTICDLSVCTGCEACVQACPAQCVRMVENDEGFMCPQIDAMKCVGCGRCRRVCPALGKLTCRRPVAAYAFRSKDEDLLARTSSGGFFSQLAEKVLSEGGVVVGAAFDENTQLHHRCIERIDDLDKLRRSKYVQSRIGNSFEDCRRFLKDGRQVLFCGTPCQVKALHSFLGETFENLIAVDFVCHGVPSPGVFRRYLEEISIRNAGEPNAVTDINFRSKELGCGTPFSFSFAARGNHVVERLDENAFLKAFLAHISLRLSCHSCPAKGFASQADYTMCDFWTVERFLPGFVTGNVPGVSQVFVFDDKLNLEETCSSGKLVRLDAQDRRLIQKWAIKSVPATVRRRRFFDAIGRSENLIGAMYRYSELTLMEKVYDKIMQKIDSVMWRFWSLELWLIGWCGK